MKRNFAILNVILILIMFFAFNCTVPKNSSTSGDSTGGTTTGSSTNLSNTWTWISGLDTANQLGCYGSLSIPSLSNLPGSREKSVSWVDLTGNFWLFGGYGYDSIGGYGSLNDLWKFDGINWTWVLGSNIRGQSGIYGTKGTANSSNIPAARSCSIKWRDSSGNLWLFGGDNGDITGNPSYLNDLWKFDGTSWTWISGSNTPGQSGTYGTIGTASSLNIPGARCCSVSWIDASNNLWLFGGEGYDSAGSNGYLNDLWMFDGANWTWVSGSNIINQKGIYGTIGTASSSNFPGSRYSSVNWKDSSNNLFLFGGYGKDSAGNQGRINDLWKYNIIDKTWTWISGSNIRSQPGIYGTKGTANSLNVPGAREESICWVDSYGNFLLFGGYGMDKAGSTWSLNDLWKFDGTNWTWISGSNSIIQSGSYGTKGVSSASNIPGARNCSICWIDSNYILWMFGGYGYDSAGTNGYLNDLWKYQP
jgi:N-acetylneuraminic acid mutarotase